MYRCLQCQKEINLVPGTSIRCPSCGFKVFAKTRDPITKTVKAL